MSWSATRRRVSVGGPARGVAAQIVRMKRCRHSRRRSRKRPEGSSFPSWQRFPWRERALWEDFAHLLELLSRPPELHQEYGRRLRRAVLKRWSLGVFYRPTPRFVIVVGLIDLRRDPAAIRRRLGLHEGASEFVAGPTMALPSGISFSSDHKVHLPDRFNVAVPFIDRHVAERGAKAAIRTAQRDRHLCRAGRAGEPRRQRAAGAGAEARRPAADGGEGLPGVLLSVLGGDQGGHRAGAAQHAAARGRLRLHVRGLGLRARRLFDRVRGRDRAGAEAGAGRGADGRCLPRRDGEGLAGARSAARGADRRLLLALFLRLDRPAQGRGPCPSRHGGDQRALRRARAGRRRERHLLFGGQAVLRLWARQRHDLPAVDRQHGDARRPPADARHDLREHRALQADALFRRADALRRAARRARRQAAHARQHPRLRLGGRAVAGRHLPPLEGEDRHGDPRRHRLDRVPAHLHRQPARRLPAGHQRQAGAGLRGQGARQRRQAGGEGRERRAVDPRGVGRQVLLEQAREDGRDHGRRLAEHRRHLPRGPRRLPGLRGPQRRHAEGRRHLVLADRDRELPDHPSRGARGGGGRPGRCRRADQAQGDRGAEAGRRWRRQA